MQTKNKIIVVSQHYPPDRSTTAAILSAIAEHLAMEAPVLVVSGRRDPPQLVRQATVICPWLKSGTGCQQRLRSSRRAVAEILFTMRTFFALLNELRRGDVVLTVTAPFMLPYAVVAAAKLKRSRSVLIMHDLFPDVLVMAGVLGEGSLIAKAIRAVNSWMFRALNAVVTIGRDTEALLLRYGEMIREKIVSFRTGQPLAPGYGRRTTEIPFGRQASRALSPACQATLASRMIRSWYSRRRNCCGKIPPSIFCSRAGVSVSKNLKALQGEANLPNVTFVERVAEQDLERLLSAADVWIIPYRKNVSGVSIPSRFYNLLAVGRSVILISEPEAEAAVTVTENGLGWVVLPGMPAEQAQALRAASLSNDPSMAERAVAVAENFSLAGR